jgi:hypothetical protein
MNKGKQESALEPGLRAVWNRTQQRHFFAGLLALCRWAIPLFLLGILLDWLSYLPGPGRAVVLIILVGVSFFQAWKHGWRRLRGFDATRTALEVEDRQGGLESLLVTAVQFGNKEPTHGNSESLRQVTMQKAEGAARGLQPREIVHFKALRVPLQFAAGLVGVIALFAYLNGPFLSVGFTRIFTPWVEVVYPTDTKLDLPVEDLVIKEGERETIEIGVSGVVPQKANFYLRTGGGSERKLEIEIINGSCKYVIASASRDFAYRVKAGDARSDWLKVRVIPPPRIEKVEVELEFPIYLERDSQTVEALTLSVPEETKIRWKLTLDRPVREAVLNQDGEEPKRLEIDEGKELIIAEMVDASRGYKFSWVDQEHGFEFASPRSFLQVSSDQSPRVELISPGGNLLAVLGRPVDLVVRASDDHDIGSSSIIYRVNLRPEQSVSLETPLKNGAGEQEVDWDYREVLPGLKVGDTVSFVLQVSDKYPDGPHFARSDTRRITFLSKEDYLEQIQKKKDRLLSRVQTAYRQERAAFESVRSLKPNSADYLQSCQVEAIRQELVREQLKSIAKNLKDLLDDLEANNMSDAPQADSLEQFRLKLLEIAEGHLAEAASRLRFQSGIAAGSTNESPDPSSAARTVNGAARELSRLVLVRSIDSAQEVYAREARMLAQVQASLRWRCVQSSSLEERVSIAKEQGELAQWTLRLITDIQDGMRYEKRPLAVLRLIQSVKDLQRAQAEERMRQSADLIKQGQPNQAERLQSGLVTTLLDAEFSVRLSGAYSTLIKTRDQIHSILKAQTRLREQCSILSSQAFEESVTQNGQAQIELRKRLLTLLIQTVPVPRTMLFDETWPQVPPIRDLLSKADMAMVNAIDQFASNQQEATLSKQLDAEQVLRSLSQLVADWSVEVGLQTLGLSTLVAVTGERLSFIEEYEAKVVSLLEETDIAAVEESNVSALVESQLFLIDELDDFKRHLAQQIQSSADQDTPPLLSRIERVDQALRNAVTFLLANAADEAISQQEQAADVLAEAFALVTAQNERLSLLQSLFMFQRSVGFAVNYVGDIVAEQQDMILATKALKSDDASALFPTLSNLRRCVDEVAPLLDLVASRLDAGTPLAFAVADLEDAVAALQDGDKLDSLDAQEVAMESLEEVLGLVKAVRSEAGYVAEIVEFLHAAIADLAILEYQQEELALQAEVTPPDNEKYKALDQKQSALLKLAEKDGNILVSVTGMLAYSEPVKLMEQALSDLNSIDAPAAAAKMTLVQEKLVDNAESLFAVITMLHGLPDVDILEHRDPKGVERLVEVLAVATAHKKLFRDTNKAEEESRKAFAKRQGALANRCLQLSKVGESHRLLAKASIQLEAASNALLSPDLDKIKLHQKRALETLRHFIIEQALILETAAPPSVAQDADPAADGEGSDSESDFSAGFIADFVSGEAPKDQRTGWKVRGDRNRAALNQNFARELPLEYRGLLKNYYERVAK